MDMTRRPGILGYEDYRYVKLLGGGVLLALLLYILEQPLDGEAYGGTWLGYLLGFVSLFNVGILMWYGIAKRHTPREPDRRLSSAGRKQQLGVAGQNASSATDSDRRKHGAKGSWRYGRTLQGWLSAHVYLGASLLVFATLHAGFQFGWNVHTLSYVLMLLVIGSGFMGLFAFRSYPRMMMANLRDDTLEGLLLKIGELDELARVRALDLPDDVNALVLQSRNGTRIGGGFWQQLSGVQRDCPTAFAVQQVLALGKKYTAHNQPVLMRDLYAVLLHKEKLVMRTRQQIALQARLQGWQYFHAPLSVAMLTTLAIHVFSICFYW